MVGQLTKTQREFRDVLAECRSLFEEKLHDCDTSWHILCPSSLIDQPSIKAKCIHSLEITGESLVGEGIRPEFITPINYSIVGLVQLEEGSIDNVDMTLDEILAPCGSYAKEPYKLTTKKDHDYGEAWYSIRVSSCTNLILTKTKHIKEIEYLGSTTLVSEDIDTNYMSIMNYAVFGAIKLHE